MYTQKQIIITICYIIVWIIIVYTIDSLFFRHEFLQRLIANIGIMIVFVAIYLKFKIPPIQREIIKR